MPMHPDRPLVIKTGVQFTTKVRYLHTDKSRERTERSEEGTDTTTFALLFQVTREISRVELPAENQSVH